MATFTKGPWKLTAVAGSCVGVIPKVRPSGVAARDVEDIASVCLEQEQIPREQAMANAKLIADAPEIHRLLAEVVSRYAGSAMDDAESFPAFANLIRECRAMVRRHTKTER